MFYSLFLAVDGENEGNVEQQDNKSAKVIKFFLKNYCILYI